MSSERFLFVLHLLVLLDRLLHLLNKKNKSIKRESEENRLALSKLSGPIGSSIPNHQEKASLPKFFYLHHNVNMTPEYMFLFLFFHVSNLYNCISTFGLMNCSNCSSGRICNKTKYSKYKQTCIKTLTLYKFKIENQTK